jgi:hypothetical protein
MGKDGMPFGLKERRVKPASLSDYSRHINE